MTEEAKAEALEPEQPSGAAAEASEPDEPKSVDLLTPELLAKLRWVVPSVWLVGVIIVGATTGPQLAFLTAAAGVLVLVITLMWSSVQSLTGGAPIGFEEALSMGAPSKVEEEKRAVLRALKDLEYERSVGKISPEDYAELSSKYRAEAKRLIQSLDETLGAAREEVEKAIQRRLERAGLPSAQPASSETKPAVVEPPVEPTDQAPAKQPEPPEEAS